MFKGKNINNGLYNENCLVDPETGSIFGHDINNLHGDYIHIGIKLSNGSEATIRLFRK